MFKTGSYDSIGCTHTNAGTHKDVGINDYAHRDMVSNLQPKAKVIKNLVIKVPNPLDIDSRNR